LITEAKTGLVSWEAVLSPHLALDLVGASEMGKSSVEFRFVFDGSNQRHW
jgi:hypothetical protein